MAGTIQPAVVGATGYAGLELTRLLCRHQQVKKPILFSRDGQSSAPASLNEAYPHISENGDFPLQPFEWSALRSKGVDILFFATPHEVSREWVPEAMREGVRVVDLSGAWRLLHREFRAVYQFHDSDPELAE
ncbi:MAG TPA: N-acetyl-gamma-glutamyl-phosphate reductase, partial [Candidatus Angelobacter sp.]|nr:N-acetyl-gamma-glutamyl-phosphate reductase [Candidatus Angelobacter sp.]